MIEIMKACRVLLVFFLLLCLPFLSYAEEKRAENSQDLIYKLIDKPLYFKNKRDIAIAYRYSKSDMGAFIQLCQSGRVKEFDVR
jgi:hypothetical protein